MPPCPSTHRPAGTYSAGAERRAGQRDPGEREACSAGVPGARGRGGRPWAEASLGVPAAAPRGHDLQALGPGGTRAPLTAQRGWPPAAWPESQHCTRSRPEPVPCASPARSARSLDLADRAGLLPLPLRQLRAMDGGSSAPRHSRRQPPPASLHRLVTLRGPSAARYPARRLPSSKCMPRRSLNSYPPTYISSPTPNQD